MLNNKGFAVSSALYTLLIAFLLFLGAALAQFTSSIGLLNKANEDLINGVDFKAQQRNPNGACINTDIEGKYDWYLQYKDDNENKNERVVSNTIIKIKSRYGTKYWPKDFKYKDNQGNYVQAELTPTNDHKDATADDGEYESYDGKIKVKVSKESVGEVGFKNSKFFISIRDAKTGLPADYPEKNEITLSDGETYMGIFNQCQK